MSPLNSMLNVPDVPCDERLCIHRNMVLEHQHSDPSLAKIAAVVIPPIPEPMTMHPGVWKALFGLTLFVSLTTATSSDFSRKGVVVRKPRAQEPNLAQHNFVDRTEGQYGVCLSNTNISQRDNPSDDETGNHNHTTLWKQRNSGDSCSIG